MRQKEIISPLFQVPFEGVHMTWLKQGASTLFVTETFLQFWLAYPAVTSFVSPDAGLKVIQTYMAWRTRTELWIAFGSQG